MKKIRLFAVLIIYLTGAIRGNYCSFESLAKAAHWSQRHHFFSTLKTVDGLVCPSLFVLFFLSFSFCSFFSLFFFFFFSLFPFWTVFCQSKPKLSTHIVVKRYLNPNLPIKVFWQGYKIGTITPTNHCLFVFLYIFTFVTPGTLDIEWLLYDCTIATF